MSASASCQDIRFSDGSRFCFDIKRINSSTFEAQVSSKSTSSSISCNLTLPDNRSVSLNNCEWRFNYDGNDIGPIHLRASWRTTYDLLTNYDFRNWTFDGYYSSYNSSSSYYYNDYYPEISYVSDSRPDRDEWIDVTLKVKRNNSSYDYDWRVDFYVERYNWGSWSRASSYEYDLDKTSYTFSRSDRWEVKLYNLLRFRESWEYRLVAELRDSSSNTYETFNVGGYSSSSSSSSSSYSAREISVYSTSPSNPSTYQWVDVTIRAMASNWNIASNYNKRVKIEVQEYRNGSWRTAEFSNYDLSQESYTFSTSDDWRKTFNSLVRFRKTWEYRLKFTEEYDSSVYGTKTINVDYTSDNYYNNYNNYSSSSSYNAKELSVYSISSTNPSTYQWVNVTLRALTNNWSIASNYNKRVRIEVQEYRNGTWRSASSSDYDLDKTYYTFSTSDNWSKTFNSLVRFRTSWEFRLKFTEDNDSSVYGTRTINVGYSNSYNSSSSYSSSYSARELSVYSVSSTNPSTNQWVNVTLRAMASNWYVASNYNKRVRIEVQEYRNGSWRSASSSDYDLDRTYYTFSTSDNGSKTFTSLVRFRTSWEFRLKFTEDNDSSVYGTRTFNVGGSSYYSNSSSRYYYSYGNFSDNELKKIRAVYDIWDNVISALERDYPRLRNSSSWRSRSDTFKRNMKDVLTDNRSSSFRDWSDFYNWFMDWLRYTTETR